MWQDYCLSKPFSSPPRHTTKLYFSPFVAVNWNHRSILALPLASLCRWAGDLISLCLSFVIFNMKILRVPPKWVVVGMKEFTQQALGEHGFRHLDGSLAQE